MNIGDKVICVDDKDIKRHTPPVRSGEVYIVRGVGAGRSGTGIHVHGSIGLIDPFSLKENPYRYDRFRPFYDLCLEQLIDCCAHEQPVGQKK